MPSTEKKVGSSLIHCDSDLLPEFAAEYGMPMDDRELERIDMCHIKYYALLEKKRFLAPISESPQKILDLGCGTG